MSNSISPPYPQRGVIEIELEDRILERLVTKGKSDPKWVKGLSDHRVQSPPVKHSFSHNDIEMRL